MEAEVELEAVVEVVVEAVVEVVVEAVVEVVVEAEAEAEAEVSGGGVAVGTREAWKREYPLGTRPPAISFRHSSTDATSPTRHTCSASPDASQCDALSKARLTRVSSGLAKPQPVMMAAC